MFASKFNKTVFTVNTKGFTFTKLADLYAANGADAVYKLDGLYISRGKLGEQPIFICDKLNQLVNVPAHLTDTAKKILADAEAVQEIKDGKVGFTIYKYESHGRDCYGINFVDF